MPCAGTLAWWNRGCITPPIRGLSLLGVVITNMMAARRAEQRMVTAQAVTDARLEELTREVRAHNNFAQRVPVLEEQLRVANHRLSNLEKAHTPAGRAIS